MENFIPGRQAWPRHKEHHAEYQQAQNDSENVLQTLPLQIY